MEPLKQILYGGDYNPEQWPRETWEEDMRMLKNAHINTLTLNVFSWALLQPDEDTFDFSLLDDIMDLAAASDMHVILATATAAVPPWISAKYPEVMRADKRGVRKRGGGRQNHCPTSADFRRLQLRLVEEIARRYSGRPEILYWHISNEYSGSCYCQSCEQAFHNWLRTKYKTVQAMNEAWNAAFWSHTYHDFDEVPVPGRLSDGMQGGKAVLPGLSLDYQRFMSDALLENFKAERDVIRKYDLHTPVTTNLMAGCGDLDYRKWAREMDVVSWDNYPARDTTASTIAFWHDLMRGIKDQKPFILMEQSPNQQNWMPYNYVKRPGQMKEMSYQTMAHGGDDILFFQMKQSRSGCEKFHGAVITHRGKEDSRAYQEVRSLGRELERLSCIRGAETPARAALLFDYESWWAINGNVGPSVLVGYPEETARWYKAMFDLQLDVDVIFWDSDFSRYDLIVAPLAYIARDDSVDKIRDFMEKGGIFVTTVLSGMADETDRIHLGGYPGLWRDLAGLWIDETDALEKGEKIPISLFNQEVQGSVLCDLIHPETATALGVYEKEFYAGTPAVTQNRTGKGRFIYCGTFLDESGMELLMRWLCRKAGIEAKAYAGVEKKTRVSDKGRFHFVMNQRREATPVDLSFEGTDLITGRHISGMVMLDPYQTMIIRENG